MSYKEPDIKKLYYSIGEVSEMFAVNASLIRFWENEFDVIKPKKNNKGNRLFTPEDIDNFKLIYNLVKEQGLTLEGAKKYLKENKKQISYQLKTEKSHLWEIAQRLNRIKASLLELKTVL